MKRRLNHSSRCMVLCMVVICSIHCNGQELPTSREDLGTATVIAFNDRVGVRFSMPVQQVDTAELRRRAIASTADAIRRFAGVNLRDYGGAGGLKTVSVRGIGAEHTVVSYDGLVLSDSRSGTTDLSRFPIENLSMLQLNVCDQAELLCPVRQLGSATLHLRSMRPDTTRNGLQGAVSLQQGSFGLWQPALRLGQNIGKGHTVGVNALWLHAENNYPYHVSNGLASYDERRHNNRVDDWHIEANYEGIGTGWGSISAKAFFGRSQRRLPGPVVLYVNENNEHLAERTAFAQVHYERSFRSWQFFGAAKCSWNESLYSDYDKGHPDGVMRQNYWQHEAYVTLGIGWSHGPIALAYAADGDIQWLSSNLSTNNHAHRASLLQSLSLRLSLRRIEITARGLLQLHRNHLRGNEESAPNVGKFTPSFSLRWLIIDHRVLHLRARTYYNNVYRLPTFVENYYYHYGNPLLRPERAQQFGMGMTAELRVSASLRMSLTADAYMNNVRDKIVGIPLTTWLWQTQNIGRVRVRGLDVTAQVEWTVADGHRIGLHGNYTWQQVRDRSDKNLRSYNLQLAYTPTSSGSVSMSWENKWVCLSGALVGSSSRWSTHTHTQTTRLPEYTELNFSVWKIFKLRGRTSLLIRADLVNAFDKRYEIVRRYPMPGRNYRISAELKF